MDVHAQCGMARDAAPSTPTAALPIPGQTTRKTRDDSLDHCVLDEYLTKQSPVLTERFTVSDIIRNPNLAKAARRELDGQAAAPPSSSTAGSTNGLSDIDSHEAEIERQRHAVMSLDQQVEDESSVNRAQSQLVIERLQSSVKCAHAPPHPCMSIETRSAGGVRNVSGCFGACLPSRMERQIDPQARQPAAPHGTSLRSACAC
jgi:hypothetical protein